MSPWTGSGRISSPTVWRGVIVFNTLFAAAALVFAVVLFLQASTAITALCALRADRQEQVANSEKFLRHHPNGIPGISAKVIEVQIEAQRQTIDALSILSCQGRGN